MGRRAAGKALLALSTSLLLGLACGSAAPRAAAGPASVPIVAAGPSNCPADRVQDITFSGGVEGHLACQSAPSSCFWNPPQFTKLIATIPLQVDGKPATL